MPKYVFDVADRKLLHALQTDNRRSIAALCDIAGLTVQTCHRRLKRLRDCGVIQAEVALVDPASGERPLTVFIEFALEKQGTQARLEVERRWAALPEISMMWAIAGKSDFLAIGQFRDLDHYYAFANAEMMADDAIRHRNTTFSINRLKSDLVVDFGPLGLA